MAGEKIVLNNVFFERASSNLKKVSHQELDNLASLLKKYPNIKIEVQGYTDGNGNPDDLLLLSQERAWVVKNYLVLQGIDEQRIKSKGYGSKRPISKDDSESERMKNRRVEVKIIKN